MTKNANGFTLLEFLIGVSVFAIGIPAVAAMYLTAIKNNASGYAANQALFLAQAQLETLCGLPLDADALIPGNYAAANNPMDMEKNAGGLYTLTWDVTSHGTFSKDIAVTVSWRHQGRQRNITLHERILQRNGSS